MNLREYIEASNKQEKDRMSAIIKDSKDKNPVYAGVGGFTAGAGLVILGKAVKDILASGATNLGENAMIAIGGAAMVSMGVGVVKSMTADTIAIMKMENPNSKPTTMDAIKQMVIDYKNSYTK